jgi:hypothetical protein
VRLVFASRKRRKLFLIVPCRSESPWPRWNMKNSNRPRFVPQGSPDWALC